VSRAILPIKDQRPLFERAFDGLLQLADRRSKAEPADWNDRQILGDLRARQAQVTLHAVLFDFLVRIEEIVDRVKPEALIQPQGAPVIGVDSQFYETDAGG